MKTDQASRIPTLFGICLALALVAGCSLQGANDSPVTGTTSSGLTGPVTITLAAPAPLSAIAPVLEGSSSVQTNSSSTVVSGAISALGTSGFSGGVSSVVNDVWSRGTAHLATNVHVRGTLYATSSVTSLGDVIQATNTAPPFDPTSTLTWKVTYPSGTATNVTVAQKATQSLSPGLYGTVTVDSTGTLTLSSGTYYLTNLVVQAQAKVLVNQTNGPVVVYVSTTLTPGGTFYTQGADGGPGAAVDLALIYLGSTSFAVGDTSCTIISGTCGPFNGAIVAPFATVTLQAISHAVHTGFFAASTVVLAANAQVQYGVPGAVVTAAAPPSTVCNQLLSGLVPPSQLAIFCSTCQLPGDSDGDGVPDCLDGCPFDSNKTAPGQCGCGTADTDSDGDGVPDCLDQCPHDPNNTSPGQCGCVGSTSLPALPAGTSCTDTACPQTGATCNGAGVCGNRSACTPASSCTYYTLAGTGYWICGDGLPAPNGSTSPDGGPSDSGAGVVVTGQLPENNAQASCSAKGLTLTRINTLSQNQLLARLVSSALWLGANDISAANVWRWSAPNTNNGDQFWSGGAAGSPVNGLFAYWASGAPQTQNCSVLDPKNGGHWSDVSCSEAHGYVCEYQPPLPPRLPRVIPGLPGQPPPATTPCVAEFAPDGGDLPDSAAQLEYEVQQAQMGNFIGAAAPPVPDGSVCSLDHDFDAEALSFQAADAGAGCHFTPQLNSIECFSDQQCAQYGTGSVCRQKLDTQGCVPTGSGDGGSPTDANSCTTHASCGTVTCPWPSSPNCQQIEICTTGTSFDAGPDPGSNLDAEAFNPAALFDAGLPDVGPSGAYYDPPMFSGPQHTWCNAVPQNKIPTANQPSSGKGGSSGSGTKISFKFDPDLIFDVDPNPAALMENGLNLHAQAKLSASVSLNNFLGESYSADILDAVAGLAAHRCSISDDETQLTIFGIDFLDTGLFHVPTFNSDDPSSPLHGVTTTCNQAFSNFILWASRAKKAFRDAQQLLSQYHGAHDAGASLPNTLCDDIMSTVGAENVPFFPGGLDCYANESPEFTINRFVDYLQAPGFGQVAQLEQAIGQLGNATTALTKALSSAADLQLDFAHINEEESITVLEAQFAIGPIPMVLEVDVFAAYGIDGQLLTELNFPYNPLSQAGSANNNKVADVQVTVAPYAAAGLSAFVGAGIDLGPVGAAIGIEGSVTLADIEAPIFGGAGLTMDIKSDVRPIPSDVGPPVSVIGPLVGSLFQFGLPTSAQVGVYYKFGAGLDLDNILSGEIDGKVEIKFFFFSKTWRKQIVHFNGWSAHFDFVKAGSLPLGTIGSTTSTAQPIPNAQNAGESTTYTEGTTPAGMNEAQFPLTMLARLPDLDAGGPPPDGGDAAPPVTVSFDQTNLQKFFYDDLCCAKPRQNCALAGTPQCCPGANCTVPEGGAWDSGTCVVACIAQGGDCLTDAATCCSGFICSVNGTCDPPCGTQGKACQSGGDCCQGLTCPSGTCQGPTQPPP